MKKDFTQEFLVGVRVAVIVGVLLIGANYLFAWAGPGYTTVGSTPPNDNVPAPINVGTVAQTKQGTLGVGGLGVFGGFLLQDGTQGTGKVLTSLDTNGNAAWSDVYFSQRLRLPVNSTIPNTTTTSLTQQLGQHSLCFLVENATFTVTNGAFNNGDAVACVVSRDASGNWSLSALRDRSNTQTYVACRAICLGGSTPPTATVYNTYPQNAVVGDKNLDFSYFP